MRPGPLKTLRIPWCQMKPDGSHADMAPPTWRIRQGNNGEIVARLGRGSVDALLHDISDPLECVAAIKVATVFAPAGWPTLVPAKTAKAIVPMTTYTGTLCGHQPKPTFDAEGGFGPWQIVPGSSCDGGSPTIAFLNLNNETIARNCDDPFDTLDVRGAERASVPLDLGVGCLPGQSSTTYTYVAPTNKVELEPPPPDLFASFFPGPTVDPAATITQLVPMPTVNMPSGAVQNTGVSVGAGALAVAGIAVGLGTWALFNRISARIGARRAQSQADQASIESTRQNAIPALNVELETF